MTDRMCTRCVRVDTTRLAAYAAVATGAAFGASSSVDAAVVIVNITPANAKTNFNINLDAAGFGGANTYKFNNNGTLTTSSFVAHINANNQADSLQYVATALVGTNVLLNAADNWDGGSKYVVFPSAGQTVYLGFRLTVGEGDNRYGWIEYVNNGTGTTVSRWAYESDLNTGITTPTASAVPGGAGLAALAVGAAGLRGRRRTQN